MLAFYLAASIALTGYDLWADSATTSRRVKQVRVARKISRTHEISLQTRRSQMGHPTALLDGKSAASAVKIG